MDLGNALSREKAVKGLKSLGRLRFKLNHETIITVSALILILFIAFTIRILPVKWEIQAGSVHLSEFDPYYQFSLTKYMVNNGLLAPYYPTQWVDTQRWYPEGINMGLSLPALPMTTALFYDILSALGINIDLMTFCGFMPAVFGTVSVLLLYFLGKDLAGKAIGMFAALFLALSPSVIQRTSLGFYDTETLGLFSLILFSILFLRAIDEERSINSTILYSLGAAGALAYFVASWGAAYYVIGLTAVFAFAMLLLKRYSRKLFIAYSISFGVALFIAINIPYLSPTYLISYAVLPVAGVFALMVLNEVVRNLASQREKVALAIVIVGGLVASLTAIFALGYASSIAGKFLTVIDPLVRESNALVQSVAEHKITAWASIYYDLGVTILFFIVGLFFIARNLSTRNLFLLLFGLTTLYFASSMVRLLVLLAPAFGLIAAIGIVGILRPFVTLLKEPPKTMAKKKFALEHVGREYSGVAVFLIFIILMTNLAIAPQTGGIPRVYRQAYSPVTVTSGSLAIVPNQPVSEWLNMLTYLQGFNNPGTVVCSWWDYGYWISLLGNATSMADNATINATQIENIGYIFMSNETNAIRMLRQYNAKYILVYTTFATDGSFSDGAGGDNGKWTWMARISGGARDRLISEGFEDATTSWTNESAFGSISNETNAWVWNDKGTNSTIYKLMTWSKNQWCSAQGVTDPDEATVSEPTYLIEEFFSGKTLSTSTAQSQYGSLIPMVALYRIDYDKYDQDHPSS